MEFDPYRNLIWTELRCGYPTHPDLGKLQGETTSDTEHPGAYYQRMKKMWKMETDQSPDGNTLHTAMFRKIILEGLPEPVRSKLEDIVGLQHKPEAEFCEHLTHTLDRHRIAERKLREQEKEIMKKVAQLQLGQLTAKVKKAKGIQAPVITEEQPQSQLNVAQVPLQQLEQPPTYAAAAVTQPQAMQLQPSQLPAPPSTVPTQLSQPQMAPIVIYAQPHPGQQAYPQPNTQFAP